MTGLARKEGLVLGRRNPDEGASRPVWARIPAARIKTAKEPRP